VLLGQFPGDACCACHAARGWCRGDPQRRRAGLASGQLAVTYTPPVTDGGSPITGYEVSIDGGTTWWPCVGTSGTCTLTNLANGTRYSVSLRAVNAVGAGAVARQRRHDHAVFQGDWTELHG
jgi:titin